MAASRSSSVSDENGICRDYLWGICNMGTQCIYGHVFLFEAMKEALKFCHDYQNRTGCTRPDCTYLHTSREEENLFLTTGRIPRLLLDRYARMSYNMTDFDERAEFAPSPMEYKYEYMEQPPPPPPAFPPPSSIINSQSQQMQANLMVSCTQFPMQRPMAGPMQGPPPPPPPLPPPAQTGPMQVPIQGPMAGPMQGPPPPPPPLPPPAQTGPMQVPIQGPMAGPMQGPPPPPPPLPPPAQTGPMQVPIQGPMAGPMQGPPPPPPPLPPPSAQTRSMCPYPHQDIQVLMSCPIQGPMAGPLQRPMSGPMQGPPPPPLPPPSAQTRPIQVPMSCPRQGPMAGPAQGSIAGPIQDPMQGHIPYCMPDPMQIQLQYPIQYPQRLRTRSTPMSASMPHPPPPPLPATSVSSSRTCAVHAGHPTTSFNYQPATNQQSFPVLFNPTRPPPPLFQNQLVYKRSADEYEAGPSKLRKLDPSNGDCSKCTEMTIRCKLINLNTDALKKLNAIHQASVERKAREIEQKKKFVLPMLSPEMWLLAEQYVIHVALEGYIYQHHQRHSDVLG